MAVKIRLTRRGRKKLAIFDVIVTDARSPRDGQFIEKLGVYNPNSNPAFIDIDAEKAFQWVMKGAQPTDTVKAILSYRGIMYRKHLQIGVAKGAITQEEADKRLAEWTEKKEAKISGKTEQLASAKAADAKARLEAETKVKEARAEAQRKKQEEAEAAARAAEAPAAEEGATEEAAGEETTQE